MATSCEDILGRFLERRAAQGVLAQTMRAVRDIYNGDVVVPLPERESGVGLGDFTVTDGE